MASSIQKEIQLKSEILNTRQWDTLYIGGGTPSLLPISTMESMLRELNNSGISMHWEEFTFEMNPEHVNQDYVESLLDLGVTRISLGVQTFNEEKLEYLNRGHSRAEAIKSIDLIKRYPELSLGVDLIFGIPGMADKEFENDLLMLTDQDPDHISAYSLTIEPGTKFGLQEKKGEFVRQPDKQYLEWFLKTDEYLVSKGYEHYEISNYSRNGKRSIHNSQYWMGDAYEGFGPSAHSFADDIRKWNIANNGKYMEAIRSGKIPEEKEKLTEKDRINEKIMTNLRTEAGLDVETLARETRINIYDLNRKYIGEQIQTGNAHYKEGRLSLSLKGWFISDEIISNLFID